MIFGPTISLKKTEVLYQPPPREAYSPSHISIDGTNLNFASRIGLSQMMLQSARILTTALSKASSSFGRLSKRVWQSMAPPLHKDSDIQSRRRSQPPVRCRHPGSLSEADQATCAVFINASCAPSLASNGKTTCQTKKSSREPACPA